MKAQVRSWGRKIWRYGLLGLLLWAVFMLGVFLGRGFPVDEAQELEIVSVMCPDEICAAALGHTPANAKDKAVVRREKLTCTYFFAPEWWEKKKVFWVGDWNGDVKLPAGVAEGVKWPPAEPKYDVLAKAKCPPLYFKVERK